MSSTLHQVLMDRRVELVREIRNLNDSTIPLIQKEERMLELDTEMEIVEEQIKLVEMGEEAAVIELWR